MAMQRPNRINYRKSSRVLEVDFAEASYQLPAELLRVFSPSAEVRGHGAGERKLQSGKKYVKITGIDPVGNYAIRLVFDDGHDSGIYAFDYLAELEAANASRLPVIAVGQWTPKE